MRIRPDPSTRTPVIDSPESEKTTNPEKANTSSPGKFYRDIFEIAPDPTPLDIASGKKGEIEAGRGFKLTPADVKQTEPSLAMRREQAVDEIGRGYLGQGGPYQNFEVTARDIHKKEGTDGVKRFCNDIDAELKKNFGPEAKLDFEIRTLDNGTLFLDLEQTRPNPEGGQNRLSGGLALSNPT